VHTAEFLRTYNPARPKRSSVAFARRLLPIMPMYLGFFLSAVRTEASSQDWPRVTTTDKVCSLISRLSSASTKEPTTNFGRVWENRSG